MAQITGTYTFGAHAELKAFQWQLKHDENLHGSEPEKAHQGEDDRWHLLVLFRTQKAKTAADYMLKGLRMEKQLLLDAFRETYLMDNDELRALLKQLSKDQIDLATFSRQTLFEEAFRLTLEAL